MSNDLDPLLDQLADLLAHGGRTPFLGSPLLTPERKWFPDRWTPDLASARRLLLRLADYAGLAHLGIEVSLFPSDGDPCWLPPMLVRQAQGDGPVAAFLGINEGTAHFAVEKVWLSEPFLPLGVLAHEMAHAWRHAMELHVKDQDLEELLTDLTTIALGWGILTSNAAYQYRTSGGLRGLIPTMAWSHQRAGYLSVEAMSALLAMYAVARGDDLDQIRHHLGTTQADTFNRAVDWIESIDLGARLGLSADMGPVEGIQGARELHPPVSRAGAVLHQLVVRLVDTVGEDGGILKSPVPFPVSCYEEAHDALAMWGRADVRGGWSRTLLLVNDPEWSTRVLVLESVDGAMTTRTALGHLTETVCSRKQALERTLEPLFDPASTHIAALLPAVPGFVLVGSPVVLGAGEVERLFRRAVGRFPADQITTETRWLGQFGTQVRDRLLKELEGRAPSLDRRSGRNPRSDWWSEVSNPARAGAELTMVGREAVE